MPVTLRLMSSVSFAGCEQAKVSAKTLTNTIVSPKNFFIRSPRLLFVTMWSMDQSKIPSLARYLTGSSHGNSLGQGMGFGPVFGYGR